MHPQKLPISLRSTRAAALLLILLGRMGGMRAEEPPAMQQKAALESNEARGGAEGGRKMPLGQFLGDTKWLMYAGKAQDGDDRFRRPF